jgi:hypothetical protein
MPTPSVVDIKIRLQQLGLYTGALDAAKGDDYRAAVSTFQAAHRLLVDGIAGPATRSILMPQGDLPPHLPSRDEDLQLDGDDHVKPIWPRQPDMERFFGRPGENLTTLVLPFTMKYHEDDDTYPVKRFQIHEKVHDSALRCFTRIADAYDEASRAKIGIDEFGGCFNLRAMRGGTRLSMHSWGIAIDFDPDDNQLRWGGDRARLAKPDCRTFWKIWAEEGWVSLGQARNFDWMHVQAARL